MAEILIDRLTAPGDVVLDPFAGFGTTPAVAERLGREGWGVERLAARAACIKGRISVPERIVTADARALPAPLLPPVRAS